METEAQDQGVFVRGRMIREGFTEDLMEGDDSGEAKRKGHGGILVRDI